MSELAANLCDAAIKRFVGSIGSQREGDESFEGLATNSLCLRE